MRNILSKLKFLARVHTIKGHLLIFSIALMLPLTIFSSALIWYSVVSTRASLEKFAASYAQSNSNIIDNEIHTMIVLLSNGARCDLSQETLQSLQNTFEKALRVQDATVIFYDLENHPILKIGKLGGLKPTRDRSAEFFGQLSTNEAFSISTLLLGLNDRPFTQISVPVSCKGEQKGTLSVNIPASYWSTILSRVIPWSFGKSAISDANGRFIVHSPNTKDKTDRDWEETLANTISTKEFITKKNQDISILRPQRYVFHQSKFSGWISIVETPLSILDFPQQKLYRALLAAGIAVTLISFILIIFFSRKISIPITKLALYAKDFSAAHSIPLHKSNVEEVNDVAIALARASHDLETSYGALRASEERYRQATNVFQGAVISYDGIRKSVYCSPRFYDMFGKELSWLEILRTRNLTVFHPDDRANVLQHINKVFESNTTHQEVEYRIKGSSGNWIWIWDRIHIQRDGNNQPVRVIGALLDITERKVAEEHLGLMVNELNHRVRNTLTIVQSIAYNTLRSGAPIESILKQFEERLIALAGAHDLLTRQNWEGATIQSIVERSLVAYRQKDSTSFEISGDEIWVSPQIAITLSMAFHELGTNASKYGALSNDNGHILISWKKIDNFNSQNQSVIQLEWKEQGGPPVKKPTRRGFGSRLIQRSLANDPNGSVTIDYNPEGVRCHFQWTHLDRIINR